MSANEELGRRAADSRPWLEFDRGWIYCFMCPMLDKDFYFRAINCRKKTRRQILRWVKTHRCCGYKEKKNETHSENV